MPNARAGGATPQLLLLLMIAIWGASYSAVKASLDRGVPPNVLIAARFWLAVLCLLPLLRRTGRLGALAATWRPGLLTGAALLLGYALQTAGMRGTTASMGGFLSGLIVLLVAIGARFVFGERLRAPTIVGLLLGFAGLALLCLPAGSGDDAVAAGPGGDARTNTLAGILLQVASSCWYAGHILLISRLSPPGREVPYCLWQLLTVAVGATLLVPITGGLGDLERYGSDGVALGCIAYLGALATALGIAVQSRVQPRIRPGQVAVLFATQPAFAATGGWLLLGDRLGAIEWTGGALIAIGLLVGSRGQAGGAAAGNGSCDAPRPRAA